MPQPPGTRRSRASRRKGARGELEVAGVFRAHGFDARRTPNSGGLSWRGDVQGVPGYVLEVKRCERLTLPAWLDQAYGAASSGEVPVVVFRQSASGTGRDGSPRGRWHAVIPLEELARLVARDSSHPRDDEQPSSAAGLLGCGV